MKLGIRRKTPATPSDESLDLFLNVDEIDNQMTELVAAIEEIDGSHRHATETGDFVEFHSIAGLVLERVIPGRGRG